MTNDDELWPVGSWLSAALEDPKVCAEMKRDINAWFEGGGHVRRTPAPEGGVVAHSTDALVDRFAIALKAKLNAASEKYGYTDGWLRDDWRADLTRDIRAHLDKGDPRDVAAYCAFAWHHGWSTASPVVPVGREDIEVVSEWLEIAKETPKPLHSSLNYVPVCASEIEAIERILAALGTKTTDTGREG